MFVFDGSGVSGRRGAAGVAVLVLVSAGAAALWWWPSRPEPKPEPTPRTYACVSTFTDESQKARALETCRRQAEDASRRTLLPAGNAVMDPTATRIYDAVQSAVCQGGCTQGRPAGSADVAWVRAVLRDAGFPGATVRLARPADPAPDESVVYAVRLSGDRCVVAYAEMGRGPSNNGVAGLLPNGDCLTTP